MDEPVFNLTEKQRIFCHEYVRDWNATRAAKVAGYSENTAKQIGSENLTKLDIKQYIEYIQVDLAKLAGISKLRNIEELQKIAYSTIAHLHNTWIELKEFEALTEDQKCAIESIDTKTEKRTVRVNESTDIDVDTIYVKIKLHSKTKAIEMLNSMMGWNAPSKSEIDHKNNGNSFEPTKLVFKKKS